jgi:hypothetical protein
MRHARSCYDHLAGRVAVHLFERWVAARVLRWRGEEVCLTGKGRQFFIDRGIEVDAFERKKRPLCRTCVDWSERKHHLGGAIGAAVLAGALVKSWAVRGPHSRAVTFSEEIRRVVFIGAGSSRAASPPSARSFGWTGQLARNGMKGTRSRRVTLGRSCAIAVLKWSVASCAPQAASLT